MASFNVKLYKNTGFNIRNIPSSSSILDGIDSSNILNIDAVWILQDDIGSIKIKVNWNNVKDADYCKIGNIYYFVTGIAMLNENTARVNLQLDALTTVGINNINLINGWCTRRHVKDDKIFDNNLVENFLPSEVSVTNGSLIAPLAYPRQNIAIDLIASTCFLDNQDTIAKKYVEAVQEGETPGSDYVMVPQIPPIPPDYATRVSMGMGIAENRAYKQLPNNVLHILAIRKLNDAGDTVSYLVDNREWYNNIIAQLWGLGLQGVITSSYTIKWYGDSFSSYTVVGEHGFLDSIDLNTFMGEPSEELNFEYEVPNYTIRNKKVFSGQYNKYTCMSLCNGDMQEFLASQIKGNSPRPYFWLNADASPTGCTYCRPFYFEGLTGEKFPDGLIKTCRGSQWQNNQLINQYSAGYGLTLGNRINNQNVAIASLASTGLSAIGSTINSIGSNVSDITSYDANKNLLSNLRMNPTGASIETELALRESLQGKMNTAASGIGNMMALNTLAQGINSVANTGFNFLNNQLNLDTHAYLVAPSINFPLSPNLSDYIGNGFYLTRERLSDNDAIRYDKYLTAFGYATSEPLTMDCFNCRTYFNYVQAIDVNFEFKNNNNFGLRMREMIISQLGQGVRFWHVLPNSTVGRSAFNYNPIVAG